MKKPFVLSLCILCSCSSYNKEVSVANIYSTSNRTPMGTVEFSDSSKGLLVKVDIENLSKGEHGFHIHTNPSCENILDKNGKLQLGLGAGGHYDPNKTQKHLGPNNSLGHKGDLPVLKTNEDGVVYNKFYINNLKLSDIKNRSVVIHANGDNYSDTPVELGGGGERIACGIIE